MNKFFLLSLLFATLTVSAQDWWTKTKTEAVPGDLKYAHLLVERFKTGKSDDVPPSAYLDKSKQGEMHPLVKETNNNLDKYNSELRAIFKNYKFEYTLVSKTRSADEEKYPPADYRYSLKHQVYLRKYQKNGQTRHFYTYVYYFHDRVSDKDFPYIYLFDEERLESLEKLVGFLNSL